MKDRSKNLSQKCPVTFALDIFGDKWSLLILRDILFKSKKYYGDFLQSPEKISTNILANRLQKLESDGLISKSRDPQVRSRFIYKVTPKGAALLPAMLEIIEWSATYNPQKNVPSNIIDGAPANLIKRSHTDRASLIKDILANID